MENSVQLNIQKIVQFGILKDDSAYIIIFYNVIYLIYILSEI